MVLAGAILLATLHSTGTGEVYADLPRRAGDRIGWQPAGAGRLPAGRHLKTDRYKNQSIWA